MNGTSTSEEIEVNPDFEELLEAFNEMHEEAQRLAILNKKLKSELKLHITKLASTQGERTESASFGQNQLAPVPGDGRDYRR